MNTNDIFSFLKSQFAIDCQEIDESTGLFSEGFLDSFSIVDLVLYLENVNGIKVRPTDVNLDNLDSVAKILKFVNRECSSLS